MQAGPQWITQVLRSIDSTAADFQNDISSLVEVGGSWVDSSMQKGIISVIRNAQEFLYIESQYFTGSTEEESNQVPYEIVLKIKEKIRLGKQFCVYVVVPLLPEFDTE